MGQTFTDDWLPLGKDNMFGEETDLYQVTVSRYVPEVRKDGTIGKKLIKTKPLYASHATIMKKIFDGVDKAHIKWQHYVPPTKDEMETAKNAGKPKPAGRFVDGISPSAYLEKQKETESA